MKLTNIFNKNNEKYFLFAIIIFLILMPYVKYGNLKHLDEAIRSPWEHCIEDINNLYKGTIQERKLKGEPLCFQGPILYASLYMLKIFSGNNFYWSIGIFTILFVISAYIVMHYIIKKETKKSSFFLLPILFITFLYFNIGNDLASLISLVFILLIFYTLFYTNLKHKDFFIGILIAVTIFSKLTNALLVAIILIYYLKDLIIKKKINSILNLLVRISIPILAVFIMLEKIFPNFLIYPFTSSQHQVVNSIPETFSIFIRDYIFNINLITLFIMFLFLTSLYLFVKKKDVISAITFFGFISIVYITLRRNEHVEFINFYYDTKLLAAVAFFILMLVIWLYKVDNSLEKKVVIVLLIIMLYIGIKSALITMSYNRLEYEVGYSFHYLPKQEGKILTDDIQGVLNRLDLYSIPYSKEDHMEFYTGINTTTDIERRTEFMAYGLDYDIFLEDIYNKTIPVTKDILEGGYSLLVFGPALWASDVFRLLGISTHLLEQNIVVKENESIFGYFPFKCPVIYPTLEHKCNSCNYLTIALFKNESDCEIAKYNLSNYYKDNERFSSICNKDQNVTNVIIKDIGTKNNITMDRICNSGNYLVKQNEEKRLTSIDILLLSSAGILVVILYINRRRLRLN